MFLTIIVSFVTILFTWAVAFPIGIYSATHQYSWGDYGLSFLGFLGIAIPNFMLALVMMYVANVVFGTTIGGLMAPDYIGKPWSWDKVKSVLEHSWIPVVVIGTSGTAGMNKPPRISIHACVRGDSLPLITSMRTCSLRRSAYAAISRNTAELKYHCNSSHALEPMLSA